MDAAALRDARSAPRTPAPNPAHPAFLSLLRSRFKDSLTINRIKEYESQSLMVRPRDATCCLLTRHIVTANLCRRPKLGAFLLYAHVLHHQFSSIGTRPQHSGPIFLHAGVQCRSDGGYSSHSAAATHHSSAACAARHGHVPAPAYFLNSLHHLYPPPP